MSATIGPSHANGRCHWAVLCLLLRSEMLLCMQLSILWVCVSLALWRSIMGVVICAKPDLKYLYRWGHLSHDHDCLPASPVLVKLTSSDL